MKTKQFTLLQLFSIVDGRLSTTIDDVYLMLNHICNTDLMTHHLPVALDYIKEKNPKWFKEIDQRLTIIKSRCKSNTFETVIGYIKDNVNGKYDIPQLKDEFDTSDFSHYMFKNSLLLKIGKKKNF